MSNHEYDIDRSTNYIDTIVPSCTDILKPNGYNLSYHWQLQDGRSIYLYIFLNIMENNEGQTYILAKTNLDSEEVRGQGLYLWNFLQRKLTEISHAGYKQISKQTLLHIAKPNEYAEKIVRSTKGYTEKEGSFFKVYM